MKIFHTDVRVHSRTHLELKTTIPVTKSGRETYHVRLYIFSPAQLNISSITGNQPQAVLTDITVRSRFSSPTLSLENLTDLQCELSPLTRIRRILEQTMVGPTDHSSIIYELQTLVNNFRNEMKNVSRLIIEQSSRPSAKTVCTRRIERLIPPVTRLTDALRELNQTFLEPIFSDSVRTAGQWSDECISQLIIETYAEIFMVARQIPLSSTILTRLEEAVAGEERYRDEYEYISFKKTGRPHNDEIVSYRTSVLKKWSQSALYIKTEISKLPKQMGHLFAGFAAASAMTFAVLASVYAQNTYNQNTLPWALIIILAYVFKDRIKEVLRDVLGKGIPKLIADRITRYRDPATNSVVGRAKVRIEYLRPRELPVNIHARRYERDNPFRELFPEDQIVSYTRNIKFDSNRLLKAHTRLEGLSEIIRVRLDKWMKEMDDPEDRHYTIDAGEVLEFQGKKVYHLHIILALSGRTRHDDEQLFHYKAVVSRNGLIRVEQV